jgi:TonB-linked SusC/RagA family outer membrane protein
MRRRSGLTEFLSSWLKTASLSCGLLVLGAAGAQAQEGGTIQGTVTDAASGQPVAGARVDVEGSGLSALANEAGNFRIANVPSGSHTLVARRLGYAQARQVVTVREGEVTRADIQVQIAAIQLEQVVVTGTPGGARARTIGSSVAVIDAAEAQELARAPNFTSLLHTRAPGVTLNQSSGRIGASPSLTIRGRSSLGLGNEPLIYIDGVRVNSETGLDAFGGQLGAQGSAVRGRLNDIHPDDIASVEIIKGPAASTIYGTEASNGVIQIITKRGARSQEPQFTMRLQYGSLFFRDAEGRVPTNYFRNAEGQVLTWNAVRQERERNTPLFRRGRSSEVHTSLSGGTDAFRYYASAAVRDETGVEPNNFGDQISLHSNVDVDITSDLTFSSSLNYTQIESHLGTEQGVSAMLGAVCGHDQIFRNSRGFCLGFPPELPWELYDNSDVTNRFTGSGSLAYQMAPWLRHRLTLGMDNVSSDARSLERFAPDDLAVYLAPAMAAGRIGQTLRDRRAYTMDYAGTASAALTPALASRSSLGFQIDRVEARTSTLGGMGFPASGIELIGATATPLPSSQSELINTTVGAYVQQQFGWEDRLFLTAALRVDNNSAFGEELRWVTYPKVDASWIISEEPFWRWRDVVNTFRVRTAYGESGRAPAAFTALRSFTPVQGPAGTNAVTAGSLGNPHLKPERGREWEVGFESMLLGRVNLDFTYFSRQTLDLIVNQPVAPSTGFSGTVPRNLGRVDNSGFELAAGFDALRGRRVGWRIDTNLGRHEDEIRELGDVPGAVSSAGTANRVGYPIGGYWSRRVVSADLDPATGQAINVLCDGGPDSGPVACAEAPFVFLGSTAPKTTGAIGNTVSIGERLRLYALVDFASGHLRVNIDEQLRCMGLAGAPMCEINMYPERFDPVQVAQASIMAFVQGTTSHYYQDASFAKLREVSVSYLLPDGWIPGTSRTSLTLSGRELATWTNFAGLDPENTSQAILPPLTRFTASLNIGF